MEETCCHDRRSTSHDGKGNGAAALIKNYVIEMTPSKMFSVFIVSSTSALWESNGNDSCDGYCCKDCKRNSIKGIKASAVSIILARAWHIIQRTSLPQWCPLVSRGGIPWQFNLSLHQPQPICLKVGVWQVINKSLHLWKFCMKCHKFSIFYAWSKKLKTHYLTLNVYNI